uniref:Netrin 5 n=1 Tax=Oryzias sinensis TaxID=183150 RepID=A0A8C7YBQ1_9TELE
MFLPFSPSPSTLLVPILLRLFILILSLTPTSSSFSHTPLSWTSPHDPCYNPDGRPRHCLSEFINAAYGVPVNASNSLCVHNTDGNITTLTDLHNPNNITCWMAHAGHETGDWVLTLPLGRRFEITYISVQFCNQEEPPDPISLSIFKSMDYGRSWRPLQRYSSDCVVHFQQPTQTIAQTRHQETDALCSDPRPFQRQRGGAVLAFSALDGRPSSPDFDYSPTLQDWVTATDIRIVFHHISQNFKAGSFSRPKETAWNDGAGDARGTGSPTWRSDIQLGGRCKCNGHASRCRRDDTGRAVCVCEHHTAGPDCDVCADFYVDRPWHRATPTHPNPCLAMNELLILKLELITNAVHTSRRVTNNLDCKNETCPSPEALSCNACLHFISFSLLPPCPTPPTPHPAAEECVSYCQPTQAEVRMNLETYCLKDYVLKVQVKGMERSGPWWQFSITVQVVFRTRSTSRVRRGPQSLWVPNRDLACGCPALHVGRTFLLIGAEEGERGWGPEESRLVADRSTLALQWREHWSPKLRAFRGQDKRGRCPSKSDPMFTSSR